MRRKAFLIMAALALLAASQTTGAWAAAPFGWFDGLLSFHNAGNGVQPVSGWALADTGVFAVDIVVDGVVIGRATLGRSRPRVTKLYPGFPDSKAPGYGYQLDTTHFLNGMHSVTARVTSRSGEVAYLDAVNLQFTNTNANLLPFGKIEFPNQGAEMFGNCANVGDPSRRIVYNVLSGYALDVNTPFNRPGVAYTELLIDGAILYNSQRDCRFLRAAGGPTNCYGIRRLDVEQNFPGLKDSPHAGFRFVLDVGALVGTTDDFGEPLYTQGSHQLTIRAGDQFENVEDIATIDVTFSCLDNTNEDLAIGAIDQPVTGLLYGGLITVSGWAVDLQGVNAVVVYVDGTALFLANLGLPRPDIVSEYPSYPAAPAPGWFGYIDSTKLSNGIHQVSAIVIDNNNVQTFIGKFPITVANPIP